MANIKSQKKRNLTNAKRAERNKAVRSELKTRVKSALVTVGTDDNEEAVRLAVKRLDKAAAKGVIHPNQAARRKSRLLKTVNAGLTPAPREWPGNAMMDRTRIRNFSIIAHIDHGKSTLSDRILEITGAVEARDMREQYLDSMDLERERGITIKAQNVRVEWNGYTFHLIDTPGHVDFGYEVSRSLAACEGVVLVVDAAQGIEAQTLANCYLALEHDLEIVAALNKIDLPAADPDRYAMEIETVLGIPAEDIVRISAKTGEGVPELLDTIVARIPAPEGDADAPLQALIFDSQFDQYRGVVSSVRVVNGRLAHWVEAALHAGGGDPRADRDRRAQAGPDAGRRARAQARSATSSPGSRTSPRPAPVRRSRP